MTRGIRPASDATPIPAIDFGIVTVLEEELSAVLDYLPSHTALSTERRIYNLCRVETNRKDHYTVAVVRSLEQGQDEAIDVTRDLIQDLSPTWLILVGIAAGIRAGNVQLGDVVVSSRIADIQGTKLEEAHLTGGGIAREAANVVANLPAIERQIPDWNRLIRAANPALFRQPHVTAGAIASINRLVRNDDELSGLLRQVRGIKAVEMESAGAYKVATARKVPFLSFRGIAEILGEKSERNSWRRYACHSAASFLAEFLRTRPLPPKAMSSSLAAARSSDNVVIAKRQEVPFHISRLTLVDVRGFKAFELPLPKTPHALGQWVVILGANGLGKTTILRSIALSLCPDEVIQAVLGRLGATSPMVRTGAMTATIQIQCPAGDMPRLELSTGDAGDRLRDRGNGDIASPFVVAYGCRRGSALGGASRAVLLSSPLMAVATLFDESADLVHAETWLKERKLASLNAKDGDSLFFNAVVKMLVGLLPGVEAIHVNADSVEVEGPRIGRIPLGTLSDGYLTTMGWVIDMLARWAHDARGRGLKLDGSFARQMTGVAIVDEIDLHLHPRWQRDVIRDLRKFFPRMSFIVTTHNPLTLLGARPGEIQVLNYDADASCIIPRQVDLPLGAGADQVLTGEWFDLASTLDDSTLALLAKHRRILRGGSANSAKGKRVEEQLNERLGSYASTSIERLAQSAAAQVLRDSAVTLTAQERAQARTKIAQRLSTSRGASFRRKRST